MLKSAFDSYIALSKQKGTNMLYTNDENIRKGCKDVWNAFMCRGALFSNNDIPFCPTTAKAIPKKIVTWEEAKRIYKKRITKDKGFSYDAFICFYIDDYKFDGERGIWNRYNEALKIIKHFTGVITPDFSTCQDFPYPQKIYNTYRMRAFGYWLGVNGIQVINNVRWGTSETFVYCFDGIPKRSIIAIGTVGGSPRKQIDRSRFEVGLFKMVEELEPHTIIVYGSANYPCFDELRKQGIKIVSFQSCTAAYFEGRSSR